MPVAYKGATIPLSSDLADGPAAFRDYTDSLPVSDAFKMGMVPIGTVIHNVRAVAPTGWLLLDGATVTNGQTLYPDLWLIVPATWKSGANLVLPNSKGRILIGIDPAQAGIDTAGELAGAATATIAGGNLPSHTHTQNGSFGSGGQSANHDHGIQRGITAAAQSAQMNVWDLAQNTGLGYSATQIENQTHGHVTTISGETGGGPGASTPISILPPVLALNAFIRAA